MLLHSSDDFQAVHDKYINVSPLDVHNRYMARGSSAELGTHAGRDGELPNRGGGRDKGGKGGGVKDNDPGDRGRGAAGGSSGGMVGGGGGGGGGGGPGEDEGWSRGDSSVSPLIPPFLKKLYMALPRHIGPQPDAEGLLNALRERALPDKPRSVLQWQMFRKWHECFRVTLASEMHQVFPSDRRCEGHKDTFLALYFACSRLGKRA